MPEREAENLRDARDPAEEAPGSRSSIDVHGHDAGRQAGGVDLSGLETNSRETAQRRGVGGRLKGGVGRLFAPVRARLASLFSISAFLLGGGLSLVGVVLLGAVLPFGGIGDLLGIAIATFGYGLASSDSHYLEFGVAGAAVGGSWSFLGNLLFALVGGGGPLFAVGIVGGAIAAVLGQYFGRDLRDGLTRDL